MAILHHFIPSDLDYSPGSIEPGSPREDSPGSIEPGSPRKDEEIVTALDMDWVDTLEKSLSDTKFRDRNREPTIYKVPDILKNVDRQAYEPLVVSLGPYHHDKPHLQAMNQLKRKYLKFVLEENPGVALVDYVDRIMEMETRVRNAYAEKVEMSSDSFVEMMLLDGCFVMLTIMEWNKEMKISEESTLWTRVHVLRDIFLLENQLPFFLLETLYEYAFPGNNPFRTLAIKVICLMKIINSELPSENETFHHLIHLVHSCIDPTRNHGNGNQSSTFGFLRRSKLVKTLVSLPPKLYSSLLSQVNKICPALIANPEDAELVYSAWMPSATVLNEAGIHFEIKKRAQSFLDITFHKGKLQIPKLIIGGLTNIILRNLIAYEQCSMDCEFHVSFYARFMGYLIDTEADVELLRQDEIIVSALGDSRDVATLFNKLPLQVVFMKKTGYLFGAINAMLRQRNTKCSKWRAMLNRNYFSNPWAAISLFGALLLFVLTAIQTVYAILSYVRSRN